MNEKQPFLRAAGLVGAIIACSRVLGLVRDMVLSACFGATRMGDLFLVAFELPNLVRRVLGEGSLSAFVVPIVTKVRSEEGEEKAWRFGSNALTVLAALSLALTALGILLAHPLFSIMSYGYTQRLDYEAVAMGVRLTRIMFPFLMLLALSSVLMGLCHSLRHFTTPALGSVMLNIAMIATGLFFIKRPKETIALCLGVSVLAGAMLRLLIMLPPLARRGFRYRPVFDPWSPAMRRLFAMMLPAFFGLAVVQINITVSRAFATTLGEGYVAALTFSNRLVQLPLAIIASAMASAILPQLSQYWVENRRDDLRALALFAFRLVFILFLPATVGLMTLGQPIVRVLFERGGWTPQATAWTHWALLFYAPALVVWGMMQILTPIYYAQHDVRTPVLTATATMLLNVLLNATLILVDPLREALGHGGLALANTISVLLNASLLLLILRRRGLALWDRSLTSTALRTLAAGAAMGVAAGWFWRLAAPLRESSRILETVLLALCVTASAGVYFAAAYALRIPDLREALAIVGGRKGGDSGRGRAPRGGPFLRP